MKTVETRYAPLVYARTAYLDFRPDFIGAPEGLARDALRRVRAGVHAALDYAEELRHGPRWVQFREGDHLVAGVVAKAEWLSDDLTFELQDGPDGQVTRRRPLHAFVGGAFALRGAAAFVPPRSQAFYSQAYEEVVRPRFFERLSSKDWQDATVTAFRPVDVDAASLADALPHDEGVVHIHPEADADRLWLAVAAGQGVPSLCTGAPSGRHAQQRHFDIVTQADIATPRAQPREDKAPRIARTARQADQRLPAELDPAAWDEAQKKSPPSRRGMGGFLTLGLLGLLAVLGLTWLLTSLRK